MQLPARAFDPLLGLLPLPAVHLHQGLAQPPAGAVQNGQRHLQIALHLFHRRLGWRRLPLRFPKQFRLGQDALARHPRPLAPRRVELPRLPRVATVRHQGGRHPLAVVRIHPRHRHQILHRHLRRELAFAHLLLDRFRQQLHQRQSPRHPAHTAIEAPRQFLQRVAEALFHLRQQPALFQRAFLGTEAQRPRQHQRFGFAHRPHGGFHRVAAELFQRRDALMAVDHQIAVAVVRRNDYDDRRLLAAVSQRGQQPALAVRIAHPQVLPPPLQLVQFQAHRLPSGFQYGGSRDWSLPAEGEVRREVLSNPADAAGTGLSRPGGVVLP